MPSLYKNTALGHTFDGFFVINDDRSDFFVWGNSSATASDGTNRFITGVDPFISIIDETTFLIDDYLIDLTTVTTGTYSITDVQAAIVSAFSLLAASSRRMKGSCVHQGRAFYWGEHDDTTPIFLPNRIYYSDAYAYATFSSATQFFDVDGEIQGAVSLGANLLIWTVNGEWFVLQGRGDPANGTLNSLGKGRIPGNLKRPARFDRRGIFLASDITCMASVGEGGGIDDTTLEHIAFSGASKAYEDSGVNRVAAANSLENAVLQLGDDVNGPTAFHLANGAWTEETWADLSWTANAIQARADERNGKEVVALYDGTDWRVYLRDIMIDAVQTTTAPDSTSYEETPDAALRLPPALPSPTTKSESTG